MAKNQDIKKEGKKPKAGAKAAPVATPAKSKGKEGPKSGSVILACGTSAKCSGPAALYQDQKYGVNRRVHTISKNGAANCTVCGATR